MKTKRLLSGLSGAVAIVSVLAACGTGGSGGDPAPAAETEEASTEAAPSYAGLDELIDVVSSTAICGEDWDTKTRSQAADSTTGMPAVDYSYQQCSLAEGDDEEPFVTIYAPQLEGTSDEVVQGIKSGGTIFNAYIIQGDGWVVAVERDSDDEEGDAYAEELAGALKTALDENASVTYLEG